MLIIILVVRLILIRVRRFGRIVLVFVLGRVCGCCMSLLCLVMRRMRRGRLSCVLRLG